MVNFEAQELSYPIITFPGTLRRPQNPENLEENVPNQIDFSKNLVRIFKKSAGRAWFEASNNEGVGIDPNRLESVKIARKLLGFEVASAARLIRD